MRIAIVNLTGGGMSGGYRKYLQELLPRLQRTPLVDALLNLLPPLDRPLSLPGSIDTRTCSHLERDPRRWIARAVEDFDADVVFIPTSQWLETGRPTVCMIRNMEPLLVPFGGNRLPESLRNLARARTARRAVTKSTRVIAVSQHVKRFLIGRWHLAEEKIGVVYHGVDRSTGPRRPSALPENFDHRFLFTAGSIRPARGLEDVIPALFRSKVELPLAVGGASDPATTHYESAMRSRTRGMPVAWLGRLSADEMAWCFRHATAFVMTSRAEACPNVVLEAMAEGALSVSTDQEPMPEFYGQAAIYYRRGDGNDLASRLESLFSMDDEDRNSLRAAALERSKAFTWEATATATVRELMLAADTVGVRARAR